MLRDVDDAIGFVSCPVCRGGAGELMAVCASCDTPHHPECWSFTGGCAVFACGGTEAATEPTARLAERLASAEPLILDEATPEPAPGTPGLSILHAPRPQRRRESAAVVAVSWVYLGLSLALAVPSCGWLVGGLASGELDTLVKGVLAVALTLALKTLGDQIAIGDPRGRRVHLAACLVCALVSVSPLATGAIICLAAPFWTRRGRLHFGPCPG
jgi:hypothetical protein